ncbi:MAG: hypothetical protein HY537_04875 [Deltaproteobacteria bacterium]|nr:hypothetical protein [Deltaproteobacteria bacterium]
MKRIFFVIFITLVGCSGSKVKNSGETAASAAAASSGPAVTNPSPTTDSQKEGSAQAGVKGNATKKTEKTGKPPSGHPPIASSALEEKKSVPQAKTEGDIHQGKPSLQGTKIICKAEKDERIVEIVETAPGCELKYTKFGETQVIASSAVGPAHCNRVRDQIKNNLEDFGYKCESPQMN